PAGWRVWQVVAGVDWCATDRCVPLVRLVNLSMAHRAIRHSMTSERPLPPRARATLVLAAAATMFLFYGAAILSITLLGALVLVLLVVAAGAARVGAAGFVAKLMAPPAQIFRI